MYELWEGLKRAKEYKWVELSHPLDNDSPFWAGIPEGSVELCKTVYDWGNPMLDCLIQTFCFPGQFGTHIDFPSHFDKEGVSSEAYGVEQLVFPLCVRQGGQGCALCGDCPGYSGLRGQIRPHP